jgi:hypothetical protein
MTKVTLFGAALLAMIFSGPALAQAVVEDPGYCAQFYPNANCTNYGPGNPLYPGHGWYGSYARYGAYARMPVWHHRYHRHHYRG